MDSETGVDPGPQGLTDAASAVLRILHVPLAPPVAHATPLGTLLREAGIAVVLEHAAAGAKLDVICASFRPDIVLLEGAPPPGTLRELSALLARLHLQALAVLLADPAEELLTEMAMAEGGYDYVHADRLARLPAVLRRAMADLRKAHLAVQAERRIAILAQTDALTGLANRTAFAEHVAESIATARRSGAMFAVLYLDLDNFKDVNDTLGHVAGDALLVAIAERLRHHVRASDVTARLGGDEFAILQTGMHEAADAGTLAAKLLAAIAVPLHLNGVERQVTASIGIALNIAGVPVEDELLIQADTALYRSKDEGRNRFSFFAPELDHAVRERVSLAEELRAALQRGEFTLCFQPLAESGNGRIVGLEALLRWNHPRRGQLLPGQFIPAAEKSGLMPAIDLWVLEQVCRQINIWREAGVPLVKIAVNLNFAPLRRASELVERIGEILARFGTSPLLLDFEMSEVALSDPGDRHGIDLQRMQMLGVRMVIDRFGLGQMSLERIGGFGFSRLKIAPRLISGNGLAGRERNIVRAAIALAREMDISVVATGVESAEQLQFLRDSGCRLVQGFFLSPPVDAAAAETLLRQGMLALPAPALVPAPMPPAASHATPASAIFDEIVRMFEKSPVAVCITEAGDTRIRHVNDMFFQLLHFAPRSFATLEDLFARTLPEPSARAALQHFLDAQSAGYWLEDDVPESFAASLTAGTGPPVDVTISLAACADFRILALVESGAGEAAARAGLRELIGFLERRAFLDRLTAEAAVVQAAGQPLALAIFDLSQFLDAEAAEGQTIGERLLRNLRPALGASMRQRDIVGRTGRGEFMLALPGTDAAGAAIVAARLRAALAHGAVRMLGKAAIRSGIATLLPGESGIDNLLIRADTALHAARLARG